MPWWKKKAQCLLHLHTAYMPDPVAELRGSFERFRDEIDSHNDKRERLIKASRDITALSKKLIFHLHRFSDRTSVV